VFFLVSINSRILTVKNAIGTENKSLSMTMFTRHP